MRAIAALLCAWSVSVAGASTLCDVPAVPEDAYALRVDLPEDATLPSLDELLSSYRSSTTIEEMARIAAPLMLRIEWTLRIDGDGERAADAANHLFFSSAPFAMRARALDVISLGDPALAMRPLRMIAERRQDAWFAVQAEVILRELDHPEAKSVVATLHENYACPE